MPSAPPPLRRGSPSFDVIMFSVVAVVAIVVAVVVSDQ